MLFGEIHIRVGFNAIWWDSHLGRTECVSVRFIFR